MSDIYYIRQTCKFISANSFYWIEKLVNEVKRIVNEIKTKLGNYLPGKKLSNRFKK